MGIKPIDLTNIYNPESFSTGRDAQHSCLFKLKRKPFEKIAASFPELIHASALSERDATLLERKIENSCRKILMACKAGEEAISCEEEIMVGQDREIPALIWDDEIELLYHVEAMILFARSFLDIIAYIFSAFLFSKRIDSFNEFRRRLVKAPDEKRVNILRKYLFKCESIQESWINLLVGTEKGRSLRDKIAHQTIVAIEYDRTEPTWEDLFCHVSFGGKLIPLENLVKEITEGIVNFCLATEDAIS